MWGAPSAVVITAVHALARTTSRFASFLCPSRCPRPIPNTRTSAPLSSPPSPGRRSLAHQTLTEAEGKKQEKELLTYLADPFTAVKVGFSGFQGLGFRLLQGLEGNAPPTWWVPPHGGPGGLRPPRVRRVWALVLPLLCCRHG